MERGWSRQSFGGVGGMAGVSRCGAPIERLYLWDQLLDGADSLEAYRQEDPSTVEVDDLD